MPRRLLLWPVFLVLVIACATKTGGFDAPAVDPREDGGTIEAEADTGVFGDVSMPEAGPSETLLYTHDNTSLYRVDPKDPKLGLTKIGDFDCIVDTATPPPGMANS